VRPIRKLTKAVANVQGNDLDFHWDMDTGDETQVLADSFRSLTERMKTYIENIQRITAERERIGAELNVAAQIQADMLPCIFPPFPDKKGIDIYAHMAPAKEVGGDFYDFFLLDDDHLALVMADVSGKGVPAALFMVISKTLIKDHAQITRSPKVILEKVNNILMENNAEEMFVTVWLGIMEISTGKITAANAGHEYPVVRGADGSFTLIKDKHGIVVGAMEDIKYRQYEMEIEPGGCLFLYTDGIPEATNEQEEMFGTGRMLDALNQDPNASPEKLLSNVMTSVNAFVGSASQFDDMTMLAMKREIEDPDPDES
jgi:sigma-B regulation protein RsbU (phosphoserine phosphatase)